MANLKVFISSTCYDLGLLRSHLRNLIQDFGYDPIMSDYSDVLYDPRIHTHSSCIQEVTNCDVLILMIGSRFGGKVVPKALDIVDMEKVKSLSSSKKIFDSTETLSITQLEVMKALECGIPIFTFVDSKVWHDHNVYEKNKDKSILAKITFPSIEKQDTATYIFEFINFIRYLTDNNSIQNFSRIDDVDNHLRKQWSGLFQRLLSEQKTKVIEEKKLEYISNQINDIKAAIFTTITSEELKETARGAIKFRGLLELLIEFEKKDLLKLIKSKLSWEQLLPKLGVKSTEEVEDHRKKYARGKRTAFVTSDTSFYMTRIRAESLPFVVRDWTDFQSLNVTTREAIYNAVIDMYTTSANDFRMLELIDMPLSKFIEEGGQQTK
jgi:hypothetical protein